MFRYRRETEPSDDAASVDGTIGNHSLVVMSVRNGLGFETTIEPDVAPLNGMIAALVDAGIETQFRPYAYMAAEMLELELVSVANEGKVVLVWPPQQVDRALVVMRDHPLGRRTVCLGRTVQSDLPLVEMTLMGGGRRIVRRTHGEESPRINREPVR